MRSAITSRWRGPRRFRHLVYPTARDGALRAHVTIDLGGQCKFGPDLSWRDAVDYRFDTSREAAFYSAVRRYWPHLGDGELQPGYTGIRPRLAGPGWLAAQHRDRLPDPG